MQVAIELGLWDDALADSERALEIRRRRLRSDDREIAHLHYQIATAAGAADGPPAAGAAADMMVHLKTRKTLQQDRQSAT